MTAQRLGIPSCPRPVSRFPQPAMATYRCGSSASASDKADTVNSLQPLVSADLEQPQNCQGTSVFLLLPRQMSTIFSQLYLLCFQSSAARPQRHAEFLCNPENQAWRSVFWRAILADFDKWEPSLAVTVTARGIVKIWQEPRPVRHSPNLDFHLSEIMHHPSGLAQGWLRHGRHGVLVSTAVFSVPPWFDFIPMAGCRSM
jgi:hypothetical protein